MQIRPTEHVLATAGALKSILGLCSLIAIAVLAVAVLILPHVVSAQSGVPDWRQRPTGLAVSPGDESGELLISWDANAQSTKTLSDYRVAWTPDGEGFKPNSETDWNAFPTSNELAVTGLSAGATYRVKVRARYDDSKFSKWSDVVTSQAGSAERFEVRVAPTPVWSAEVTIGASDNLSPAMLGYSRWSRTGAVSDRDFELEGVYYRVLALVEHAGGLYLAMSPKPPVEFTLAIGAQQFAEADSSVPDMAGAGRYWWATDTELFASGETVRASITATEDSEASANRPLAPPNAYFSDLPSSHNGADALTFQVVFTEEVVLTAATLEDHALVVGGAAITAVEQRNASSTRSWNVTVQPSGTADITLELATTTACDQSGAVCTSDGRELHNQPQVTVPGTAIAGLSDLTVSGLSLSPAFSTDETVYTAAATTGLAEVTLTAVAVRHDIVVEITPTDADTTAAGHQVTLATNADTAVTVTTTSADGSAEEQYWITINAPDESTTFTAEADPRLAQLASLSFQGLSSLSFSSDQSRYDLNVLSSRSETVVNASALFEDASVELLVVRSDDPTLTIDRTVNTGSITDTSITLSATGDTLVLLRVTSVFGQQQHVYAVIIHSTPLSQATDSRYSGLPRGVASLFPMNDYQFRFALRSAVSGDATLSDLTLTGASLRPSFAPTTTSYIAEAAADTEHVTLAITTADANAGTAVSPADADPDTSGWQIALSPPLAGGAPTTTTISIIVRSADGNNLQVYSVEVSRAAAARPEALAQEELEEYPTQLFAFVATNFDTWEALQVSPTLNANTNIYTFNDEVVPWTYFRFDAYVTGSLGAPFVINIEPVDSADSDKDAVNWRGVSWRQGNGRWAMSSYFEVRDPGRTKLRVTVTRSDGEQRIYFFSMTAVPDHSTTPNFAAVLPVDADGDMTLPTGCSFHEVEDTSDGLQPTLRWRPACNSHLEYFSKRLGTGYGETTGYARFFKMVTDETGEVSIGMTRRTSYHLVLREHDGVVIDSRHLEIDGHCRYACDDTPIVVTLDAGTYIIEAVQQYSWLGKKEYFTLDVDSDALE